MPKSHAIKILRQGGITLLATLVGACSRDLADPLPLATEALQLDELASAAGVPLSTSGFAALEREERERFEAEWKRLLGGLRIPEGAWPTRSRWRIRNHTSYARGGRSSQGDRLDEASAEAWRDQLLASREAAGLPVVADLSHRYPQGPAWHEAGGEELVPLLLLAPPHLVRQGLAEQWKDLEGALSRPARCGLAYGQRFAFRALRVSQAGDADIQIPMPARGETRNGGNPLLPSTILAWEAGSLIVQARGARMVESELTRAGIPANEVLRTTTIELMEGLWMSGIDRSGGPLQIQIGYPLLDALGSPRIERSRIDSVLGTWFENRVEWRAPMAKLDRHWVSSWPRPRQPEAEQVAWERNFSPTELERRSLVEGEMICATEEWLASGPGLWIVEYAPSSKPLAPDYIISRDVRRLEEARQSLAMVALVADLDAQLLSAVLKSMGAQ